MDPFQSMDNLTNRFNSADFCRNSEVCHVRNGAVIELPAVISINWGSSSLIGGGRFFSTLLLVMLSIAL